MEAWMDTKYRAVSMNVLEAMCDDISGTCHRFSVSKVSANKVYVEYSNPNEYGTEFPMTAQFPCYKSGNMVVVILDILRVTGDNWDGEGWQAFIQLIDQASRNPNIAKAA